MRVESAIAAVTAAGRTFYLQDGRPHVTAGRPLDSSVVSTLANYRDEVIEHIRQLEDQLTREVAAGFPGRVRPLTDTEHDGLFPPTVPSMVWYNAVSRSTPAATPQESDRCQ